MNGGYNSGLTAIGLIIMCLRTLTNEIKTAKEDILVYKIIDSKTNESLYRRFKYHRNTLYRLRKRLEIQLNYYVDDGFHSYASLGKAKEVENDLIFHPFRKVVEFTIPKGAKYIVGRSNEIVSTSIRSGSLKRI